MTRIKQRAEKHKKRLTAKKRKTPLNTRPTNEQKTPLNTRPTNKQTNKPTKKENTIRDMLLLMRSLGYAPHQYGNADSTMQQIRNQNQSITRPTNEQTNKPTKKENTIHDMLLMRSLGYAPQQYGNADSTMQQIRNQNQSTIDQINNMNNLIRSVQEETKKDKATLSDLVKQKKEADQESKEVKHTLDKTKVELDIAKEKAKDIETMHKQEEYYQEQLHNVKKQILDKEGENSQYQLQKQILDANQRKHEEEMKNTRLKQEIEENKLAKELKNIEDSNALIIAENSAMFDYMNSKEFLNPQDLLPKAYLANMKEKHKKELLDRWRETTEKNKEIKEKYDKDNDKYSEKMIEQINYNIEEQGRILATNQQQNQLLKSRETNYNHLVEIQTNTINKTHDIEIENELLKYKYDTVNRQPEIYQSTKKLQQKLAKGQERNNTLKTNIDLQNQIKQVNIENAVLNGNDSNNISLNDTNDDNNTSNNGPFSSTFTKQIEKTERLRKDLSDGLKARKKIHQRQAEDERHEEAMASRKARIKAYQTPDNDNNNNDTNETMAAIQAVHEIEEEKMDKEVNKQKLISQINELHDSRDPNGRAWHRWWDVPYPQWDYSGMTINTMDEDELKENLTTYKAKISYMEENEPELLQYKSPFHKKEDDDE